MESKCFIIEETIKLVVDQDKSINTHVQPSGKKDGEKVDKPKTPPAANPKKTRKKPEKEAPTKKPCYVTKKFWKILLPTFSKKSTDFTMKEIF